MGGDLVVKRAKVGIHDQYRGVFLNRGVFIKAPPGFFRDYPNDFEQPPAGWQKLNLKVREINNWDSKTGILKPQMELPPPEPTVVEEVKVSVPQAVAETVAAPEIPVKRGRGRPVGSGKKVVAAQGE